ncbi:MAG: hypothetical protein IJR12_07625 [Bacteroidales bacterium]|nr:hypothetical protein [Bacteroidales bacterium]
MTCDGPGNVAGGRAKFAGQAVIRRRWWDGVSQVCVFGVTCDTRCSQPQH